MRSVYESMFIRVDIGSIRLEIATQNLRAEVELSLDLIVLVIQRLDSLLFFINGIFFCWLLRWHSDHYCSVTGITRTIFLSFFAWQDMICVLWIRSPLLTPMKDDRPGRSGLAPSKMNEDKRQLAIFFI
jgi:hypothetical protein